MPSADRLKLLKNSDVEKFSGESKDEDAREFLESLDEVVMDGRMADIKILCAMSTVFLRGCATLVAYKSRHYQYMI